MRKPIIWRIQEPHCKIEADRDYTSIAGYGEMRTILGPYDNPSVDATSALDKLNAVRTEIQDGDFILWAGGDPMSAFLAGVCLAHDKISKRVKWLRWDKRTDASGNRTKHGYYTPVEFFI